MKVRWMKPPTAGRTTYTYDDFFSTVGNSDYSRENHLHKVLEKNMIRWFYLLKSELFTFFHEHLNIGVSVGRTTYRRHLSHLFSISSEIHVCLCVYIIPRMVLIGAILTENRFLQLVSVGWV